MDTNTEQVTTPKPKSGWTEERLRKFQATMKRRKAAGLKPVKKSKSPKLSSGEIEQLERIGYERIIQCVNAAMQKAEDPRSFINNCPGCGLKLTRFYLAAEKTDEPAK